MTVVSRARNILTVLLLSSILYHTNTGGSELVKTWSLQNSRVHQVGSCVVIVHCNPHSIIVIRVQTSEKEDNMLPVRPVLTTITNLLSPGVPSVAGLEDVSVLEGYTHNSE